MTTSRKKKTTVPGEAGGVAVFEQRGSDYMAKIGRRGGKRVVAKYGKTYMSLIGTLGANAVNEHLSPSAETKTAREARRIIKNRS